MPAPTFPAAADLLQGTGTRSFTAVTTAANDWLVVEIIVELGVSGVPAMSPLTWTQQNDRDDGAGRTEVFQFTTQDAVGGSRTVQIVPGTTANYRARLTVVRGSAGPGTGKGTAATQTVSVTRQGANSAMFMTVGDWSAGAVGSPVWTPGGATVASQQGGSLGTYVFGRWDDSGTAGTASHGVTSPSYGTPSIAVLEMLGTAGAGTVNGTAAAAFTFTASGSGTRTVQATAAGTLAFTATAAGVRTVPGAGASALAFNATATGTRVVSGTAASTFAFTATAAGIVSGGAGAVSGVAAAALAFTATAAGTRTVLGQESTPLSFAATASGVRTVPGVAAAAPAFAAVGAGVRTVAGSGVALLAFAASADGAGSTPGAVITRPNSGTITRPDTGTVIHILTVVVRLYTGTVSRP